VGEKRLAPGDAERFDPFGVEEFGWNAIRGRRAQTPCPFPRLLNFNPFGVRTATGTNGRQAAGEI
jgi:hypothetical protein